MNIGIIGAGSIAGTMARTVAAIPEKAKIYAIASRSLEKAQEFAREFNIPKAYGSYEEMLQNPAIDLVYIATPHSQHYQNMKLCLANNKAVLCEKAFTKNTMEAQEILREAESKNILVTEAIWTRYMTSRKIISETISSGIIGDVDHLSANLHYSIANKERMVRPELAGGALLDLGVYCLNFATMFFGNEIEKIDSEVTDADVMAEILKTQKENARTITVEDRPAKMDDEVTINFEGFIDDEAFEGGKGENYKLTLGSHSFIDTFEDQIVGKSIGDKFDVNVTFPEDYHADNLKGKPAVFKVELLAITETELPELDDEFASEVSSFETFDAYKEDVKKTLEVKKEREVKRQKQQAVVEKIAEASEVDIPEPMIEYQQERMFDEFSQNMMYQGLQMEQYLKIMNTTKEAMLEQVKPDAIARIKNGLVLDAVVEAEKIEVTDAEVDEEVAKMAESYQMEADKLKELVGDKEMESIKKDLAARKALEFLAENCKEV